MQAEKYNPIRRSITKRHFFFKLNKHLSLNLNFIYIGVNSVDGYSFTPQAIKGNLFNNLKIPNS